jgi:catechol 2,3-dioxygenase
MTVINRLSHVEIAVTDLERAREFYVDVLGLTVYADTDESLYLRAPDEFDVWSLKLALDHEPGLLTFGFRVASEEALDALARRHGAPRWLEAGTEPGRGRTLRVQTPSGHVVDFQHAIDEVPFHDAEGVHMPMRHLHTQRGVAPTRLDHINIRVPDIDAALAYWQGELDFSASELHVDPDGRPRRAWLRRAPFSHDVAMGVDAQLGFHHVAYAMRDSYALLRAADVLADAGRRVIEYGPGRHGITDGQFLYIRDPDGNRIELYAGDYVRDLDRPPVLWSGSSYEDRGLLWWGQQPPASFLLAGPVLDRGLAAPERTL